MGIGLGVFLVVVGAILVFGVNASVAGLDLTAIGYILMGAGLLVIILSLLVFMPPNSAGPPHRDHDRRPGTPGRHRTRRSDQRAVGRAILFVAGSGAVR